MDTKRPKSRRNLLDPIEGAGKGLLEKLNESRELDRNKLESEISRSGGPLQFLRAKYPELARTAPSALSDSAMTRTTLVDLSDAERRLQGCAICPAEGGKCASDYAGHKPGTQPSFQTGQLVFSSCDRWPEYQIRERIIAGGVPKRYAGISIGSLWKGLPPEAQLALKAFAKALKTGQFSSLVVGGSNSTLVCVATLRSVVMSNDLMSFYFARAPEMMQAIKVHIGDSNLPDPVMETAGVDVLVLCEVNLEDAAQWFVDTITEIIHSRFLSEKVTILGVAGDPEKIAKKLGYDASVQVCVGVVPKE